MTSSNRMAQLVLWREIVSKGDERTKPVDQHLDFIRKRFEELESQGFIWSKESILDIFLQLALPESSHGPFSATDQILDSRVHKKIKISSDQVEELDQSKELHQRPLSVGLMDLPIEVFKMIIEQLDCMAELETEEIVEQKLKGQVVISCVINEKPLAYCTYLHRNSPVLNSIQTFSLASRQIYQLCRPWLWQKLQFPTSLPAPIDLWTEDLLLKHGSYVHSLSLILSENCSRPLNSVTEYDYDPFYDNLIPVSGNEYRAKRISPKNVTDLIERCPNLSTLNMQFDYVEPDEDEDGEVGMAAFVMSLAPLIISLKQLRHLTLADNCTMTIMNDLPSKLISNLPLLESFTCNGIDTSGDHQQLGVESFGFNLSKLKYLSRLDFSLSEDIDESWTITDIRIHNCWRILPSSAHQIIQHIAPGLKKLDLCFSHQRRGDVGELDPAWNPQRRFSLPFLTDLKLSVWYANFLDSFQDCTSMNDLEWIYRSLEHCQSLNENLLKASWPQLKTLVVEPYGLHALLPSDLDDQREELNEEIVLLQKYCDQFNVESLIYRVERECRKN
ncbi:hypothetical protein DFH28DRAFT_1084593 [Melampsora americana]|nr:hypothetical protein DFH28DRAFT_1084593 [Melampsora americana]